jgi:murein L,D-transpeptidase YcbB/YkuD
LIVIKAADPPLTACHLMTFRRLRLGVIAAFSVWGASVAAAPLGTSDRTLLIQTLKAADPAVAAMDDDALAAATLAWARIEAGLRIRPSTVDRFWAIEPPVRNLAGELEAARREGRIPAWLATLPPADSRYRALSSTRDRYQRLAEGGEWTPLPAGPTPRAGEQGAVAQALRLRLSAENYDVGAGREPDRLDPLLVAALQRFQVRHGLTADGVLGRDTRAALDVSAEARLRQIDLNLERLRWTPAPLPGDRVELDIAAAEAVLYRAGMPRLRMRVVVGKPDTKTPMFASRIESVVFNPPWNVPVSIASKEISPKAQRDPTYLIRHHYVLVPTGLQQLPGPDNALGRVKFDLPSPFGVYLHDTPSRSAFARPMRALSHGCMRLEQPLELAGELLGTQGWSAVAVQAAVDARVTRRVALAQPIALQVVYRTAFVDEAGDLQFRPDVYGWDDKLSEALAAAR